MKILVISDIHGNIDSLRAVEAEEKSFDAVLVLRDGKAEFDFANQQ